VLAAVVFTAVYRLIDVRALLYMWRVSRLDFYAAVIALAGVLLLGILQGILLAAAASILLLLMRASQPHVAFLGRLPGTTLYSDLERNPQNEPLPGVIAFRPEASLTYINADVVLEAVLRRLDAAAPPSIRLVVCDLSASPFLDLSGSRALHELHKQLAARGAALRVVGARARVRDLLRADGLADKIGRFDRVTTLDAVISEAVAPGVVPPG
jgi:MFS superfamily sulfate permease-like transporter